MTQSQIKEQNYNRNLIKQHELDIFRDSYDSKEEIDRQKNRAASRIKNKNLDYEEKKSLIEFNVNAPEFNSVVKNGKLINLNKKIEDGVEITDTDIYLMSKLQKQRYYKKLVKIEKDNLLFDRYSKSISGGDEAQARTLFKVLEHKDDNLMLPDNKLQRILKQDIPKSDIVGRAKKHITKRKLKKQEIATENNNNDYNRTTILKSHAHIKHQNFGDEFEYIDTAERKPEKSILVRMDVPFLKKKYEESIDQKEAEINLDINKQLHANKLEVKNKQRIADGKPVIVSQQRKKPYVAKKKIVTEVNMHTEMHFNSLKNEFKQDIHEDIVPLDNVELDTYEYGKKIFNKLSGEAQLSLYSKFKSFTKKYNLDKLTNMLDYNKFIESIIGTEHLEEITDLVDLVIQFVIFSRQIYYSEGEMLFGIIYMFLSSQTKLTIADKLIVSATARVILRLFIVSNSVHTESFVDDIEDFNDNINYVYDSNAVSALKNMFICAAALKLFPKEIGINIIKMFGSVESDTLKNKEKLGITDIVRSGIASVIVLMRMGELLAKGIDLGTVIFSNTPVVSAKLRTKELLAYADKLYVGLPIPGYLERSQYVIECKKLHDFFDVTMKKTNPLTTKGKELFNLTLELKKVLSSLECQILKKRHKPYCIVIYGPPNIGKSYLIIYVCRLWCYLIGIPFTEDMIYSKPKNQDYWDGYNPWNPFCHISEPGSDHRDLVKTKGDDTMKELLGLADNLQCLLNTAFTDKGKVAFNSSMIVMDTNNPDMNLDVLFSNPSAFKRRLEMIGPIVKDEYRKQGSTAIDYDKCSSGEHLNRWVFKTHRHVPTSATEGNDIPFLLGEEKDDIYALTAHLLKEYTKHIKSETALALLQEEDKIYLPKTEAGAVFFNYTTDFFVYLSNVGGSIILVVDFFHKFFKFGLDFVSNVILYSMVSLASLFIPDLKQQFNTYYSIFVTIMFALMICMKLVSWERAILVFMVIAIAFKFITPLLPFYFFKKIRDNQWNKVMHKWKSVKCFFNPAVDMSFNLMEHGMQIVIYIGMVVSITHLVESVFAFIFGSSKNKKRSKKTEVSTEFKKDSQANRALNEYEDLVDSVNIRYDVVPVGNDQVATWNYQHINPQPVYNGTAHEFYLAIARNTRWVVIDSNKKLDTHLFGIRQNYALINTHALGTNEIIRIGVVPGKKMDEITEWSTLSPDDIVHMGNDVSLVRLSSVQFRDITKHIVNDDISEITSGMINFTDLIVKFSKDRMMIEDKNLGQIEINKHLEYEWKEHTTGQCGKPVICKVAKGHSICGIHVAGANHGTDSFAVFLDKKLIEKSIEQLERETLLMSISSESHHMRTILESPISKSPFMHEELRGITYYGKLPGAVLVNKKSKLEETFMSKKGILDELFFERLHIYPQQLYGKPMMKPTMRNGEYISPYNIALRKLNKERKSLDRRILQVCIDKYSSHIIKTLEQKGIKKMNPVTMDAAINGIINDPYMKRINVTTSPGFGFSGKKSDYLEIVEELNTIVTREATDELKLKVVSLLDSYSKSEQGPMICSAQLKDEPRELSKIYSGKTRVFYGAPLDALIVARMYLSPLYTTMVEHGDAFGSCVGIDMHKEAHILYKELGDMDDECNEGDYESFDTGIPFDIAWASASVEHNVLKHFGYNALALTIVRGILSDMLFPFVEMCKDLFMVPGLQPSGKYGTAEQNCIRNVMMLMYAWYSIVGLDVDFFENNLPRVYGDDLLNAVKAAFKVLFSNKVYRDFVNKEYGMGYTSANKLDDIEEHTKIEDMSFLKRKFKYHNELNRIMAPLHWDTLYKMLQWFIPSNFQSEQEQMIDTLRSFLWELYIHVDRRIYDNTREFLIKAYSDHYLIKLDYLNEKIPSYNYVTDALTIHTESRMLPTAELNFDEMQIAIDNMVSNIDEDIYLRNIDRIQDHQDLYLDDADLTFEESNLDLVNIIVLTELETSHHTYYGDDYYYDAVIHGAIPWTESHYHDLYPDNFGLLEATSFIIEEAKTYEPYIPMRWLSESNVPIVPRELDPENEVDMAYHRAGINPITFLPYLDGGVD